METNNEGIKKSSSYLVAYEDIEFLNRDDLRPVRLQLELLKPELIMEEHNIVSTIVVFGSARLMSREAAEKKLSDVEKRAAANPQQLDLQKALARARCLVDNSRYYEESREFARMVSTACQIDGRFCDYVVVTGGGPGIMEAANRGAHEVGAKSIGLNITLPFEQVPNPYITPELCFQFHYFAIRKMHFLLRTKALVVFPGGFGTLDEMFETLTLIQTHKMEAIPVLLFGKSYWQQAVNLPFLVEQGTISPEDLQLVSYVETAADAWRKIVDFYGIGSAAGTGKADG
ncbi:MAG: LOG family protein [Acidobacteria bacterium]|nr:LOG family protein [Acidobacteriota bacterium]MCZ6770270.1 LOG family protein [Acidobacteriota bacterium]MCZ6876882.1 LOG family protein [Acidobacteriota bacterium]